MLDKMIFTVTGHTSRLLGEILIKMGEILVVLKKKKMVYICADDDLDNLIPLPCSAWECV